ncbi:MAG: glycosyltransferase [Candidatus Limnocylindrales bacterium]
MAARRPRIAFLSYSSAAFDARTARMARSAVQAGFDVVVYARLQDGLPPVEQREGYRVLRAPWRWWLAFPGLRSLSRGRSKRRAAGRGTGTSGSTGSAGRGQGGAQPGSGLPGATPLDASVVRAANPDLRSRISKTVRSRFLQLAGPFGFTLRTILMFPIKPMGWSHGLEGVVEPADIWHGMWAGSLPSLLRYQRRLGGRTIYDSRDVYMESRSFARSSRPMRALLARIERRWAHRVDRVLTVNEAYADLIAAQLRVPRPPIVMNCPERWTVPVPPPDRIRHALGLPPETAIALYQGQLITDRGIEEAMEAILDVPGAVLALLGFGPLQATLEERVRTPRYAGQVFVLPAVGPDELLLWTASADVSVMAIAPTSINHRFTTPQKLFESLAAGVPVVASDLPGMAEIVTPSGAGVLCDPLSPASIAAAIRSIVDAPPDERAALRARALAAAHERYNWEAQVDTLFGLYQDLLARPPRRPAARS